MLAGASVFLVIAGGALGQIEIKFLNHRTGICRDFQLHHGWKIIPFRQNPIGHQNVALFRETEAGWRTAVAGDDRGGLFADRYGFQRLVHKSQGDFAIVGDKELDMGLNGHEDAAAVRTGHIDIVIVTMTFLAIGMGGFPVVISVVMVVFRMIVIVISMVVIVVVIIFRTADQTDRCGGEQGGEEMRFFHEIR